MVTFGERLKNLRKTRNMGQMELAEQVGVSVQSVSRWETGTCMPDIFQIVPLAKILGTSADYLLGMDSSEADELEAAYEKVAKLSNIRNISDRTEGLQNHQVNKKCYDILAPLAARYPMNYTLILKCCMFGCYHLTDVVKHKLFPYSEKEINALYTDLERMLTTVVAYEKNLGLKGEAKEWLVSIHCTMGYYGKAEVEAEDIGYDKRYVSLCAIAAAKENWDDLVLYSKKRIRTDARIYWLSLADLAFSYSVQGEPMRQKAIEVWKTTINILETERDLLGIGTASDFLSSAYHHLAKEYLRDGDIDMCLSQIEQLTELCVQYYQWINDNTDDDGKVLEHLSNDTFLYDGALTNVFSKKETLFRSKNALRWCVVSCLDDYEDRENNPIVTNERYQKCLELIDALN